MLMRLTTTMLTPALVFVLVCAPQVGVAAAAVEAAQVVVEVSATNLATASKVPAQAVCIPWHGRELCCPAPPVAALLLACCMHLCVVAVQDRMWFGP